MSAEFRRFLRQAAASGEVLRIVYHGGSQPGTVRAISPVTVAATEVQARDLATGIVKTFKLKKVELAGAESAAPEYDPGMQSGLDHGASLREVFVDKLADLHALGWHVELADEAVSVHRYFKNGKPRKGADVSLSYSEFVTDYFVELDGDLHEETRKAVRPYRVDSRRFSSGRTFGKLGRAVSLFLVEAHALAPKDAT